MSHEVETMAYAGTTPWHGLGVKVDADLSAAAMMQAAGLDWAVEKKKLRIVDGPTLKDKMALVRSTDGAYLSTVGREWKPVQNADVFGFFHRFVDAGKMRMHTAGSLCDGQYVWALAETGMDWDVKTSRGAKDSMQSFLLMMSPHRAGKAMVIQHTSVRVVCWNTLNFALGSGLKGDGSGFRMPHVMEFDDNVKRAAEEALGLAGEQVVSMKEAFARLSAAKANEDEAVAYFQDVTGKEAAAEGERSKPVLDAMKAALAHSPGAEFSSAKGTWWGALNAVTYVVDHKLGRSRDTALRSAWFGGKARMKREALELALERVAA